VSTVALHLSDTQPVPVVRVAPGGCVAVSVPRSPFRGHPSERPTVVPSDLLRRVSDSAQPDGARTDYFVAQRPGTATVTSTVAIRTAVEVPAWSGIVHIV
jgi:hypothetical protein